MTDEPQSLGGRADLATRMRIAARHVLDLAAEADALAAKLAKVEGALESWLALNIQTTKPGELLRWRSQTHQALAAIREGEKHHD